jgi:hypothetical protein
VAERRNPRPRGRTRWDALIEAASAGWRETIRLAILLLTMTTVPCSAIVAVTRLLITFALRH